MGKRIITLAILTVFFLTGQSQDNDIDEFIGHLPYNQVISLAPTNDQLYAAIPYGLFIYNHGDNSIERFSKVEGLSDINVSWISYNKQLDVLLIAYANANVDLLKDNEIINISDIERSNILGNKTINKVYMQEEYAYLACGFGIVVVDLEREEIHETYKIGPEGSLINVYDFTYHPEDNRFYAATELGVYSADSESPNLAHYIYWERDTTLNTEGTTINAIASHKNKVVVNKHTPQYTGDTLFYKQNSQWEAVESPNHTNVSNFRTFGNHLYVMHRFVLFIYDQDMNYTDKLYSYEEESPDPNDLWLDSDSTFWIADNRKGLVKSTGNLSGQFIAPSGPTSPNSFDMASSGGEVWVASGGYQSHWGGSFLRDGVYRYADGIWTSFDSENTDAFDSIPDIVSIAVEPGGGGKVYAGSWNKGLLEFDNNGITNIYNKTNSTLQGNIAEEKFIQISGLAFDDDYNLWVVNSGAENVLSVRKQNGEWRSFSMGAQASGVDLDNIVIDDYGQKWIIIRDHRLLVFNDNGTLDNPSDDYAKVLTSAAGNGALPGADEEYSLAKDLNGNIWIGTDEGVGVIYNPEDVFTGNNFDAEKPKVEVDGYIQYLLETESVKAIAVDGANNKWFGTERGGVFLMSPDGTEQEKHFSETNSPLFSNAITSIVISETGIVFIGTTKGIISYKGSATPGKKHNKDIFIYPNPVTSKYSGPISIRNLVQDANVKITDINGNLVYETFAEGGNATWNGRNFDGEQVQTGYYMVFVSNDDGSETIVSKILMIR